MKYQDTDEQAFERIQTGLINWKGGMLIAAELIIEAKVREIWKVKYDSWRDFCEIGCGITKQWANKVIEAQKVTKEIALFEDVSASKSGKPVECTFHLVPSQVTALKGLSTPEKVAVLETAKASGSGAPKAINKAVEQLAAMHAELAPKLEPEKLAPILDANGREVPEKLRALWVRADTESKELIRRLRALKSIFEDAEQAEDLAFVEMSLQTATGSLESVITGVKRVTPYAVCHTCSGAIVATCDACKGKGYVSKYFWDNCVPKELKALKL